MSPLPSPILAQMNDTVTVRLATGADAYNEMTYGDPFNVKARVTYARTTVATPGGDQRIEATVILMPDVAAMTTDAEITLPDGSVRPIKSLRRLSWPGGEPKHLQVVV